MRNAQPPEHPPTPEPADELNAVHSGYLAAGGTNKNPTILSSNMKRSVISGGQPVLIYQGALRTPAGCALD